MEFGLKFRVTIFHFLHHFDNFHLERWRIWEFRDFILDVLRKFTLKIEQIEDFGIWGFGQIFWDGHFVLCLSRREMCIWRDLIFDILSDFTLKNERF